MKKRSGTSSERGSSFNRRQLWLACKWTGRIMLPCWDIFQGHFLQLGSTCLPQHLCRRSDPVLLAAVKCLLRTLPNLDACVDSCFTIGHHQSSFNHFLYPHAVHTTLRTGRRCPGKLGLDGSSMLSQRKQVRIGRQRSYGKFTFIPNVDFSAHFPLILICLRLTLSDF